MSWKPTANIENLKLRSQVLSQTRQFFSGRGFCEVQTPVLSRDTVVDRHLDPIIVNSRSLSLPDDQVDPARNLYLQTSPEFAMKRLVAAGMTAIYQLGPAFRAGECGELHNTEFTMLEWYRRDDGFEEGIRLLEDLVAYVTPWPPAQRKTYQSVFQEILGIDPVADHTDSLAEVAVDRLKVSRDWSSDRDDWLDLLLSELIQPNLGIQTPVILTNYPASQSALARLAVDGQTAERFELFFQGVELANGYHELVDASELAARNERVNHLRQTDGKSALPVHSQMLQAMTDGLPPCSGCALGFDRLVMLLAGGRRISEVIAFPVGRA